MFLSEEHKAEATEQLKVIVQEFNEKFEAWMETTGCRAIFGWQYGLDRNVKAMEVQAIDAIIYRKAPPQFETIKNVLERDK